MKLLEIAIIFNSTKIFCGLKLCENARGGSSDAFDTYSNQIVNVYLIVKLFDAKLGLFLFAYARRSTSAKKRIERPAFFSVHVDTYEFDILRLLNYNIIYLY